MTSRASSAGRRPPDNDVPWLKTSPNWTFAAKISRLAYALFYGGAESLTH